MRFAVLSPAARELADEEERTTGGAGVVEPEDEEEEKDGEISRVVVCTRVRTSVKEDGGWAGGMATETHDERSYESFSRAQHDSPPPPAPRSFAICATRTSSPPQCTVVSRETVLSLSLSFFFSLFFPSSSLSIYLSHCARARRKSDVIHCLSLFRTLDLARRFSSRI